MILALIVYFLIAVFLIGLSLFIVSWREITYEDGELVAMALIIPIIASGLGWYWLFEKEDGNWS